MKEYIFLDTNKKLEIVILAGVWKKKLNDNLYFNEKLLQMWRQHKPNKNIYLWI